MNLKPSLYDNLTTKQRVAATIEAEARDDTAEVDRLVKSCPKKTYTMYDAAYTDSLSYLMTMALAVECDIRGQLVGFWIAVNRDRHDCAQKFLQNIADIQDAWRQTLKNIGIDPETMAKAVPPQHGAIDFLSDIMPKPDENNVQGLCGEMQWFIKM